MSDLTLPEVFRRAVEVLEAHGWTQGTYRSSSGCLCATGALAAALGGQIVEPDDDEQETLFADREHERLWSDACLAAGEAVGVGRHIVDWNDRPGRTADEVKALFLRLAEEADGG